MTQSEGDREPTLSEVLAAIAAVAVAQTEQGGALARLAEKVDGGFLATGARFDLVDARQLEATQALEALAGMAHAHEQALINLTVDLSGTREELRGEVRASEARTAGRIGAVQQVTQSVKADVAGHAGDPDAHRRHAA